MFLSFCTFNILIISPGLLHHWEFFMSFIQAEQKEHVSKCSCMLIMVYPVHPALYLVCYKEQDDDNEGVTVCVSLC